MTGQLPVLKGEGFVLRPPRGDELAQLARSMAQDPEASPWVGSDVAALERWFSDQRARTLIIDAGEPAGVITYEEETDPDYRHATIDITLLASHVNRGLGPAAIRLLASWLSDTRGHHRFTIDPAADNARAIRAYAKAGFRPVGIMRQYERSQDGIYHDSLLMDMLAGEITPNDAPAEGDAST